MVHALNNAAKLATGDILIYVSDDFECFANYDIAVQQVVKDKGDDWFLLVYDGIQKKTATILIESKKYYERYEYMYFPEYWSMWADPDATEVARRSGKLIDALHLTFKHNHYSNGGIPFDGTYAKQDGSDAWCHGEKIYHEREGINFGV